MPPELVLAGNLLIDDVVLRDGRTRMGEAGGAMLYTALGAELWGAAVGIVSVAGSDYPSDMLAALEARNIDLAGVKRLDQPGLRTWLLYEAQERRVIHHLGGAPHAEVSPRWDDLPAAFESARAYHISPMPIECQRAWIEQLSYQPNAMVTLDPHETVNEDTLGSWRALLGSVDGFFPSEDELRLDGSASDPARVLRRLGGGRLGWVALKRGARGGCLYDRLADHVVEWPAARSPVMDPTGAGDAFAGGFLAALLDTGGMDRALEQGVVAASFAIEDWGAHGLLAATPSEARRRQHEWFGSKAHP